METGIPLLSPDQIEELNNMILGISEENKKKLDDLLAEITEVENTSILNLYQLVVHEWTKKQKIIDNLCHFSLTMMATVHLLWDQKYEHEERLSSAEGVIDSLQKHIYELGDENEKYKLKINEAETHIESISGEKDKFEELYRSQSCCDFVDQGYSSEIQVQNSQISRDCVACEHKSMLEQQKEEFLKESSQHLLEKDGQITILREEKKELEKKFEELMEEHQLVKMEIQLAEIAVKDALSYRESSISNRSAIFNRSDEIYTTKSHAQFMNGELECFSNLDDSFHLERRQTLAHEISIHDSIVNFVSNPELPIDHFDQPELKSANSHEEGIANPFKKKASKKNVEDRSNTEERQLSINVNSEFNAIETKIAKEKKTVSLQCSLLKNVPRIKLFPKKVAHPIEPQRKPKSKITNESSLNPSKRPAMQVSQSVKVLSRSQIIKPAAPLAIPQPGEGSVSRFFNFISSKIITNRIKVK